MHREHEYKHLADNARKRGGEEQNAPMTPAHTTIRWIVRERCGPQVPPKLEP
jgi:hypothetical protein